MATKPPTFLLILYETTKKKNDGCKPPRWLPNLSTNQKATPLQPIRSEEVKELYKAIGVACGGAAVDRAFLDFLTELIGMASDIFRSFFKGSVDSILLHLSTLLQKPETSGVETILMVGGYSDNLLLREAIEKKFTTMKVIVPQDALLAVLEGALIIGHCPMSNKGRVSKNING
ncbi:hypothetical protein DPMN_049148 [Dreissena polymorpha]|uniref:Uncharacterized protein n=1 Tax=Dreissena polymorpha TaxID=45954 RepID=A0A9D4I0U6_DREPO|nr:hypothetical protein DPMN_049148 [Dreissena polymorpha]